MLRARAAIAALLLVAAAAAAAAEPLRIGVAAPLSGPSELLGRQLAAGAAAAAGDAALTLVDDRCSADGGAEAARAFVAAGVAIVVGFLCTDAIEAALPILKDAAIPVITPGVRTNRLTDAKPQTGWLVYRLAPRADAEGEAVASLLPRAWRDDLFAIVDDGTIYGRELAERLRAAVSRLALKPVFVDTFRPQLENQIGLVVRLRKAGATHVFVGGDRDDIAIMARDARGLGATMVFAGGEALRAASGGVPIAEGTLMVGLPEWSEVADPAVIDGLRGQGVNPEGYVLPAYAAVEIARAMAGGTPSGGYATALGDLAFDGKGDLDRTPYRLFRFADGAFREVESQ
ncbi:MAG: branched-chain amino acid ABC transporter substrate-binding protein [Rhizobiaceae bacterium]|nr:branched-chain amino acid ABC transporter substrate-binding protein [Rhizobiaceae bacterium]